MLVQGTLSWSSISEFLGSAGQKRNEGRESGMNRLVTGTNFMGTLDTYPTTALYSSTYLPLRLIGAPVHIFEQRREGWDDGMQCVNSPWVFVQNFTQYFIPYDTVEKNNRHSNTTNFFQLTRRRALTPSPLKWSRDALHTGEHVLVFLTLSLLVVACVRSYTVGQV